MVFSINKAKLKKFLNKDIGFKKVDKRIVSLFLKQLSLLLNSSISFDRALIIIKEQNIDKKLNKALESILAMVESGNNIYQAFYKNKAYFNDYVIACINSGDKSGNLSEILDELSKYIEEDNKNKNNISQAFIYPIILLFVTVVVLVVVLKNVLPTFIGIFENSKHILPLPTRILLSLASFFKSYGLLIGFLIFTLIISINFFRRKKDKRLKIDKILFNFPIFKNLRILNFQYQTSSLLYILTKGNVEIRESMEIIENSFSNEYIKNVFIGIREKIDYGYSLSEILEKNEIFSNLFVSMVKIGENSGRMAESIKKLKEYFSNEYIFKLKKLSRIAEPMLIIFMAIIVGFVVFAIALPMFDSINYFNY